MANAGARLTIAPLHPCLGARVEGIDLTGPVDDGAVRRIAEGLDEHSVLVFHDQRFDDETQKAFTRRFGPLETTIRAIGREDRLDPNLVHLSNADPDHDQRLLGWEDRRMVYQSGNQLWHTDSSFKPVPARASMLSGREVPPAGGETEFVSMRHAFTALPAETRAALQGKVAVHSVLYSRSRLAPGLFDAEQAAALPPVRHALVRRNPANGRPSLYIGAHAWYLEGMPYEESRALLDRLLAETTLPERVYRHAWRQWDFVIWDNRCVLHRGRPWDAARYRRVMQRTTVAGDGPTVEPPLAVRTAVWDGIIPEDAARC